MPRDRGLVELNGGQGDWICPPSQKVTEATFYSLSNNRDPLLEVLPQELTERSQTDPPGSVALAAATYVAGDRPPRFYNATILSSILRNCV